MEECVRPDPDFTFHFLGLKVSARGDQLSWWLDMRDEIMETAE
jgi:hypothetical protein